MRAMNLLMGILSLIGIVGLTFGLGDVALAVQSVYGPLAANVVGLLGLVLIGLNGINAGICIPKALVGTDAEQW